MFLLSWNSKTERKRLLEIFVYIQSHKAHPAGLEPPTIRLEIEYSILLSYGCMSRGEVYHKTVEVSRELLGLDSNQQPSG